MSVWERTLRLVACVALVAIASAVVPILVQLIHAAILAASTPLSRNDILVKIAEAFGVPFAAYQAMVKAYGWLMVLALVIILAGLCVLCIRCFLSVFARDKEEKRPTVSIRGVGPLFLYPETQSTGSPILTLEGVGDPPGGTYAWSVVTGVSKVQYESDTTHSSFSIRPVQASDSPRDVTIQLTYLTSAGSATARESVTVHTPRAATQVSTTTETFNGPVEYGYDFTVRYRILDQFGERFPDGSLSLTEDLSAILNPYATPFVEQSYISDANAEYNDHYTLIFRNQPVPADYIAKVRQVVWAQGAQILDHVLVWRSTHVDFE